MTVWTLPPAIQKILQTARSAHQTVVLVTGVFDLLHTEHSQFLQKAKARGDILLVGLESDERVRHLKGPTRPINDVATRQANLAAWQIADATFVLPTQFSKPADHESLIGAIKPDFLAVSSHTAHLPEKAAILQKFGGQVIVVHDFNPQVSTSQILAERQKGSS